MREQRRIESLLMAGQYSRSATGTENISGDQEEDGTPSSCSCGTGGLSPFKVGDSGNVTVGRFDLVSINNSIDFVDMALGEAILDDAAERPRLLSLDEVALVGMLFSAGDFRIVKVLLEQDRSVIVDLSGLNTEAIPVTAFMAMVESVLVRVLLTRVTTVEGEIGKILRGHLD